MKTALLRVSRSGQPNEWDDQMNTRHHTTDWAVPQDQDFLTTEQREVHMNEVSLRESLPLQSGRGHAVPEDREEHGVVLPHDGRAADDAVLVAADVNWQYQTPQEQWLSMWRGNA